MNPNAAAKGRSFKGAVAYIVHDPGQSETAERVLFTHTANLRTDDPEKAAKVMAYTAMHASQLKESAGLKATGRKTDSPVYHLSLSWIPGEHPTKAEMIETGRAALSSLGYQEHEAVFAAHGDKEHVHLHMVVNRIHPVTGKTLNPKDDHKTLQRWAHEYDKARGLEWRSPARAAKYENEKAKKAEYEAMAEVARQKNGLGKISSIRPAWRAASGATHPKSQRFQDIKARFDQRVKELSEESRAAAVRHREEWNRLKEHQAEARRNLRGRRAGRSKLREQFARSKPEYGTLLNAREEIKISQRMALRDTAARLKQANAPKVERFFERQREKRVAFRMSERRQVMREDRNLALATSTRVGLQDQASRGHLSARFNREQGQAERGSAFAAQQAEEKKTFFEKLAAGDQPQLERLKASHSAVRKDFNRQLRAAAVAAVPTSQASQRRDKAVLAVLQRSERTALRQQQGEERKALQSHWASLNEDRSRAWESYRAHRAGQAAAAAQGQGSGNGLKDIYQERSGWTDSRQTPGRAYAERIEPTRGRQSDSGGDRALKR